MQKVRERPHRARTSSRRKRREKKKTPKVDINCTNGYLYLNIKKNLNFVIIHLPVQSNGLERYQTYISRA